MLYTRSKPDDWSKVILFNLSTEHRRVLSQAALNWAYFRGQQVNGDWAVFEHCRDRHYQYSNCNVFRYQISTEQLAKIPNPGVQQYAPSVSHDGTVYFTRTGRADVWECGLRVGSSATRWGVLGS